MQYSHEERDHGNAYNNDKIIIKQKELGHLKNFKNDQWFLLDDQICGYCCNLNCKPPREAKREKCLADPIGWLKGKVICGHNQPMIWIVENGSWLEWKMEENGNKNVIMGEIKNGENINKKRQILWEHFGEMVEMVWKHYL